MRQGIQLLMILFLVLPEAGAQMIGRSVYSCAGFSKENKGFYLSYTAGQVGFYTLTDGENNVTEGFQQPLPQVSLGTGRFVEVFPNPVFDKLKVLITVKEKTDIRIDIMTLSGVVVKTENLFGLVALRECRIDFSGFPQGVYLMHVYSPADRNIDGIFKIEKL